MSDSTGVGLEDTSRLDKRQRKDVGRRSRELLLDLLKPSRRRISIAIVIVIVSQVAAVAGPLLIAYGIDTALPRAMRGNATPAILTVAAFLVAGAIDGILLGFFVRLLARISQNLLLELRVRMFRHTQRLGLDFHESYTSGRIISRQTNDLEAIGGLMNSGLDDLVSGLIFMLLTTIALFVLDPWSAVILLIGLVPLTFMVRWFQQESAVIYRESSSRSAKLVVRFVETMTGIRAVQAFRTQTANQHLYDNLSTGYRDVQYRGQRVFSIFFVSITLAGNIALGALVIIGGLRVLSGAIGVGVLMAVVLYARQFFQPVENIGMFYNAFQAASASLEKISGVLTQPPTVAEPRDPIEIGSAKGEVVFRDVEFGYSPDVITFHKFSLTIPAGQTVALVGQTGAGKTTLAKLIARFYDPLSGSVTLDGIPLSRLRDDDLRKNVVMVTQESYLFAGSVAENIELGKPGASRAEIVAAAKAVGADEFIRAMPEGYDTDVRKRGGRLSAGQRQLVSFARAFLADPHVLILDEATSSLDIPGERLVQNSLQRLLSDRTAIIIAHRLSTVEIADRILVVDAGRIVEDGTPDDLAHGDGEFSALHAAWRDSLV